MHYGGFTIGHGFFLWLIFVVKGEPGDFVVPDAFFIFEGAYQLFAMIFGGALFWAIITFFGSHLFSTIVRIQRGEFADKNPKDQMAPPYIRVVIMHLVVMFGGNAVLEQGSPMGALVILIGLKTIIDLVAHINENRTKPSNLHV